MAGTKIYGKYFNNFNNLRFANDINLIIVSADHFATPQREENKIICLKMNMKKTKVMFINYISDYEIVKRG